MDPRVINEEQPQIVIRAIKETHFLHEFSTP